MPTQPAHEKSLPAPRAAIDAGIVEGIRDGQVKAFLGVPYAAPPVGEYRWRPPQPLTPWAGVRRTIRFGASAWQLLDAKGFGPWTPEYVVQNDVSEDCLYLNIWSPDVSPEARLPVLVWIHGGAFVQGSGSVPIYNGRELASHGVVVVTINYRLGVFGFLAHPDLAQQGDHAPLGNFGLQDQIAALKWVQSNIAAFGGDPQAVTIAGQSAGAMSVHMLVGSPLAKGLFHRAIAQSGPPTLVQITSARQAQSEGQQLQAELNQPSLAAMRESSASDLTSALSPTHRFMPMVDGELIPAWPPQNSSEPNVNDVPMLVGQTSDENSGLDPCYASDEPEAFAGLIQRYFGAHAPRMSTTYLSANSSSFSAAYRHASLDRWLGAHWSWWNHRSKTTTSPTFAYLFDHVIPGQNSERYGAFHTSDVPYVFATLDAAPGRAFTEADRRVSYTMSSYWLNFIKSGDPNGAGLAIWPQLQSPSPCMMRFGAQSMAVPLFSNHTGNAVIQYVRENGPVTVLP
ncbi:MAG: hypothetical protein RLY71_3 [Pseudomonadota bacterium]